MKTFFVLLISFSPFWIPALVLVGPKVASRILFIPFVRKPKFAIVKFNGSYFPIKRTFFFGYMRMLRTKYRGGVYWKYQSAPQRLSMKYSMLHAKSSFESAKKSIEKLEGEEIVEVPSSIYEGCFWRGTPRFFEPKSRVDSQGGSIESMIDNRFSDEEISDTEIGAERDLMKSF